MSLPTWNEYQKEDNNLPTWDDYKSSNSLPSWDDYKSGSASDNIDSVDLNTIEQIESNGKNDLTSSTGAKGYYQFMPDTSAEYSKRLFGTATRDASTLTHEQQKEMANAYFHDLLKEFNGDADKAIAAYNWGQGNVEKDVKEHGSNWEEYAPDETQQYLSKYHHLEYGSEDYEHQNYKYDENKSHWQNFKDFNHEQAEQIGDMWNGLTAWINKETGNEYNQNDLDTAEREFNTEQGQDLKTEAAIAASVVAPEALVAAAPEMFAAEGAGLGLKALQWGAKGLAGSEAYQLVENGQLDARQTAIDLATGAALEGGLRVVAAPAIKQISKAVSKFIESNVENPELNNAVKNYLAAARAEELGLNWRNLRETNSKATLLDAYQSMYEQVPEVFDKGAIEDVKALARKYKNNGSHSEFISAMKAQKQAAYEEAKQLAKTDAEQRLIKVFADANKTGAAIPEEVLESTPLQKAGNKLGDWFGIDTPKAVTRAAAKRALEPETQALIKDIRGDNRRIRRELKKLEGKTGESITRKSAALNRQRNLNNKMIQYLQDGLSGKKVKIADIATAIKDVQEEQFNTGKFKGLTQRFKTLSDKFEATQVYKLQQESNVVGEVANHYAKKAFKHGVVAMTGGIMTAGKLAVASTVAAKLAKASKASNVAFAKAVAEMVESGELTDEQAEALIVDKMTRKAQLTGRLAPSISEHFNNPQ